MPRPIAKSRSFNPSRLSQYWSRRLAAMSAPAAVEKFKLIWNVPVSHLTPTKDAVFKAGADVYQDGKYVQVAFQTLGQGQFLPVAEAGANPHTGTAGTLEHVLEYKVEVLCEGRDVAARAVVALKEAHPYQVPSYEVYKLESL